MNRGWGDVVQQRCSRYAGYWLLVRPVSRFFGQRKPNFRVEQKAIKLGPAPELLPPTFRKKLLCRSAALRAERDLRLYFESKGYEARDGVSRKMRLATLSWLPCRKPVGSGVFHGPPLVCWVWLAVCGVGTSRQHLVPTGYLEHPGISCWIDGAVLEVMVMCREAVHGAPLCMGKKPLRPVVFWAVPPAPCRRASTPIHSPSDCIVRACTRTCVRGKC